MSESSLVAKKTSNLVTKTPSCSSIVNDWAKGSPLFLHLHVCLFVTLVVTHSVPTVLLVSRCSDISSVIILAFRVAIIVSWTVSRNPCEAKLSVAVDDGWVSALFWASLVNLNSFTPAVNLGTLLILGSGIKKFPPTKPVMSLINLISLTVACAPLDWPVSVISTCA